MVRIISEFVNVLIDTESFFSSTRNHSLPRAYLYFGFVSVFLLLVNWTLIWNNILPAGVMPFEKVIAGRANIEFAIPLAYFVSGFILVPINSVFVGFLLKRMKSQVKIKDVIKIGCYSFTPAVLILWMPVISLLFGFWFIYIFALGLNVYTENQFAKNLKACAGAAFISGITLLVLGSLLILFILPQGLSFVDAVKTVIIPF